MLSLLCLIIHPTARQEITIAECMPGWQKQPQAICGHGHISSLGLASRNRALLLATGDTCACGHTGCVSHFKWFLIDLILIGWYFVRKASVMQLWNLTKFQASYFELGVTELDILIQEKWLLMTGKDASNVTLQLLYQRDQGVNQNMGPCDSSAA